MTSEDPHLSSPPGGPASRAEADLQPGLARFCTVCGGALAAEAGGCDACAARGAAAGAAPPLAAGAQGPVAGALGLYFTLLAAQIVGVVLILAGDESDEAAARVLLVISGLMSVVVLAWAAARRHWVADGLRTVGGGRWYLVATGFAAVTFLVARTVVGTISGAFGVEEVSLAEPLLAIGLGWGAVLLVVAVQPAVIEELAFRGVIQGALARVLHRREAVVVAAMLFAILHLSPLSLPHLLLLGLAAGWLRVRSGSLYPAMLLHFLHNSMVIGEEWWRTG